MPNNTFILLNILKLSKISITMTCTCIDLYMILLKWVIEAGSWDPPLNRLKVMKLVDLIG